MVLYMTTYYVEVGTAPALIAHHSKALDLGDEVATEGVEIVPSWSGPTPTDQTDHAIRGAARAIAKAAVTNAPPGSWAVVWDEWGTPRRRRTALDRLAIVEGGWPPGNREASATREQALTNALTLAEATAQAARDVCRLWEAGVTTVAQIAALTGLTRPTVYARLRAAGYEPGRPLET
jgi:hypothetical protein